MKHTIQNTDCDTAFVINDAVNLEQMRAGCPNFFKTPHGEHCRFLVYRGCLIVKNTVTFTGCKPQKKTTVYAFTENDMFCIGWPFDTADAKIMINRLIKTLKYSYEVFKG